MEKAKRVQSLLTIAVAGLLTACTANQTPPATQETAHATAAKKVPCYGINKCKGTGDCGGKDHSCGGQNGCAGKAWLNLEKEVCLKIKGGSLQPLPHSE
jgi:uncharacterized membrane protein